MMKIIIDARELRTSTGRYVERFLHYLQSLESEHKFVILLKPKDFGGWLPTNPNFSKLACPYREFSFGEQLGFWRMLNKINADLVHFPMPQQPVFYRGKVVTAILDLTTARFRNPTKNFLVFSIKQQIYKWAIKRVARKSVSIITISKFVKKDTAAFTGIPLSKVDVTYPAVDRINQRPAGVPRLDGKMFLLYVGRALPHKNLERLVLAFEKLKRRHPDLMLVLAGKMDANYKQLEALVSNKRLAGSVVFTDFVSEGQLRWLYENTQAYVFPSLSEGFGLPGLEAMAHGAPVVSSNATCLPEIYGDAAHYFNPKDTNDMAQKIHEILTKPDLRRQLIKSGQIQAAKYSWRKMAQETLEIYKKVLEK